MAVSISLSITQNSQNVANNKSNVTVKVTASWTGGSHNKVVDANGTPQAKGTLKIDGTSYSFASTFNTGQTTTGSQVICTKTVDVTHAADGKKTLNCSASFATGVSSGTVTATATKTLTTIPRKSSLSVANGTLNTAQTLTVTQQATSFTHSIKAVCGNSTLYIKADGSTSTSEIKHNDCSIPFTPPLSWGNQNTIGTSVTVTYTLTTYNGSTKIGSSSYTVSYSIPNYSITIAATSYAVGDEVSKYGGYVKSVSKVRIVISATSQMGAGIKAYSTTIDGNTYTGSDFTTNVIKNSGTLTAQITVTDARGRTGTKNISIVVLPYNPPKITALTVTRCKADGTKDVSGTYFKVVFSSSVSSLNSKNTATYKLLYKKSSETTYTERTLSSFTSQYSVTNGSYILAASLDTYNVSVKVIDDFNSFEKAGTGKSGFKFFSFLTRGTGMAIGKIAELANVLDIGFQTRFSGGTMAVVAEKITDVNELKTPNTYVSVNNGSSSYTHLPDDIGNVTFTLEVLQGGAEGQIFQRLTTTSKEMPIVYIRHYYQSGWGDWLRDWGTLKNNKDLDELLTPQNCCLLSNYTYPNAPETSVASFLEVIGSGTAVTQRVTIASKDIPRTYERAYYSNSWGVWQRVGGIYPVLTAHLSADTNTVANTYTKINLVEECKIGIGLTISNNAIKIGAGIKAVKVSANVVFAVKGSGGNKYIRIKKGNTDVAWVSGSGTTDKFQSLTIPSKVISVTEGDVLSLYYHSAAANDVISAGSSAGYYTFLTVEVVA